jgi:hexosaminidase
MSRLALTLLACLGLVPASAQTFLPKPIQWSPLMDAPAKPLLGANLVADPAFPRTEDYIRPRIGATAAGKTTLRLVKADKHGDFFFGPEGYAIVNEPGKDLIIEAATEAGAFYAFHTLDALTYEGSDKQLYVRPGLLLDRPRFSWRGVMIDEGRHFFGKEQIKRMLHLMSLYKLNVLHWHLTEDQGWRVEIKKYPKLTEVGSRRDSSPVMGDRKQSDGKPYGGFYTQEDLKEIVAYATKLHITIVPEIDMPGHSSAAIAAYPELGNSDIPGYEPKVATSWGVKYYTLAPKEETFRFIDDVFAELCPIFPGAYFHIGGDEAPKDQWNKSPFAKQVMAREKLKDAHELQAYFVGRLEKLLAARGKKLIGWDEIQEGGLSKTATMMVWRDWKWAQLAADRGNPVVMAPTSHTYFDYGQGKRPDEPRFDVIGGNLPLEKVYAFEPIPPKFTAAQRQLVLGCQAQLWSEYIYNGAKLEYMAFPRVCALADVAWSSPEGRSFAEFQARLEKNLAGLNGLKVNYRRPDGGPAATTKVGRGD